MVKRIKAEEFWIPYSESSRADVHRLFKSWEDFDGHLNWIAQAAPKGGGYDKTAVRIKFEDEEVYIGRVDIQHSTDIPSPYCLADLIFSRIAPVAGIWKPPWMEGKQKSSWIPRRLEWVAKCKFFLAMYELPVKRGEFKEILDAFEYESPEIMASETIKEIQE